MSDDGADYDSGWNTGVPYFTDEEDDDYNEEEEYYDMIDLCFGGKRIEDEERVTMPVLTKYERARVIGTRAQQIALNSPLMLDPGEEKDPYKIAELELSYGKIPFKIKRYLPDGSFELWGLAELSSADEKH